MYAEESAIHDSCALPMMFQLCSLPVSLLEAVMTN
jgi:hypothetical protein